MKLFTGIFGIFCDRLTLIDPNNNLRGGFEESVIFTYSSTHQITKTRQLHPPVAQPPLCSTLWIERGGPERPEYRPPSQQPNLSEESGIMGQRGEGIRCLLHMWQGCISPSNMRRQQLMWDGQGHLHTHPIGHPVNQMMKTATFYGRKLETVQDLTGPVPTISDQLPSGLANVAGGLGKNGEVVKVEYLDGDRMIHAPDCISQGDHPISHLESAILHNNPPRRSGASSVNGGDRKALRNLSCSRLC